MGFGGTEGNLCSLAGGDGIRAVICHPWGRLVRFMLYRRWDKGLRGVLGRQLSQVLQPGETSAVPLSQAVGTPQLAPARQVVKKVM